MHFHCVLVNIVLSVETFVFITCCNKIVNFVLILSKKPINITANILFVLEELCMYLLN